MALSACDIGNPAYDRSVSLIGGADTLTVEVWYDGGNKSEPLEIWYEWLEVTDGVACTVVLPSPQLELADDLREDITQALYEYFRPVGVSDITWVPQSKHG